MLRIVPSPRYWSVHTHSKYCVNDALPSVKEIVARVKEFGQQALALTDHGNMAGSVELYPECMRRASSRSLARRCTSCLTRGPYKQRPYAYEAARRPCTTWACWPTPLRATRTW